MGELYESKVKKPWMSKTLWANLILAAVAFFPVGPIAQIITPENISLVFGIVNTILRLVTDSKITLK